MFDLILVESPVFFPNRCIDGSQGAPGQPVVDTSIEVDGVGRIYLSKRQVREAAQLYGMVEPDRYAALEERAADAAARIVELETELAEAQPILSAMAKAASRYGGDD